MVERFSVKYVNLIEAPTLEDQISKIDLSLRIGDLDVVSDHLDLKVHHPEGEVVHILTVVTGAISKVDSKKELSGVIVDIDSIRTVPSIPFDQFARTFENDLEMLRQSNKLRFFGCLKQDTIKELGPVYE